jgi:hypothetical protein
VNNFGNRIRKQRFFKGVAVGGRLALSITMKNDQGSLFEVERAASRRTANASRRRFENLLFFIFRNPALLCQWP